LASPPPRCPSFDGDLLEPELVDPDPDPDELLALDDLEVEPELDEPDFERLPEELV